MDMGRATQTNRRRLFPMPPARWRVSGVLRADLSAMPLSACGARRIWLAVALAAALPTARLHAAPPDEERPGRFKLGPLYLTPSFELKNAGVDTNAQNTS